jgi:ubiquinone/menaquinone biosynthesis C-methylase UbiE
VSSPSSHYALGSADAEHERLIRQAVWLAPYSERCFREAGIGLGQRVLDVGSGVGDVALLLARLVGPSGEVVGVERDTRSIGRARARVAEVGLHNVQFIESDVAQVRSDDSFDAAVGRYILMFLPDPASVLRSLSQFVRPGGVLVFQEASYASFIDLAAQLPLWSTGVSLIQEVFRRCGTNTEMTPVLSRIFRDAGLPAPSMRTDILVGAEEWMVDVLGSLRPQFVQFNLSFDSLGDCNTLSARLRTEVTASNAATPLPSLVSAWSRKLSQSSS